MFSSTQLIGRMGGDPEGFETKNGTGCRFSVATSSYGKGGEEFTEWHRVVVFGKSAEFCLNYLTKGSLIFVEGRNQTSSYEKDGQKHYSTDVVAWKITSLEKKKTDGGGSQAAAQTQVPAALDDVPF